MSSPACMWLLGHQSLLGSSQHFALDQSATLGSFHRLTLLSAGNDQESCPEQLKSLSTWHCATQSIRHSGKVQALSFSSLIFATGFCACPCMAFSSWLRLSSVGSALVQPTSNGDQWTRDVIYHIFCHLCSSAFLSKRQQEVASLSKVVVYKEAAPNLLMIN